MKNIVIYENERVEDLYPFSINHCSWEIRCGCLRLFEKVKAHNPKSNISFKGRKKWIDSFTKRFEINSNIIPDNDVLYICGNTILHNSSWKEIRNLVKTKDSFLIRNNSEIVGFYLKSINEEISNYINNNELLDLNSQEFSGIEIIDIDEIIQINYLWDAIFVNGKQITDDAIFLKSFHNYFTSDHHGVFAVNPTNILIGKNVKVAPSVVLDSSDGIIIIGDNVKIMPQTTILGPCYIGDNSIIKIGAKIYGDNSIGEWCKVGGELENTIIHSYSNKQHEGFLGHSYIGEWVNFGADTNNSDLKNTYSSISMTLPHKEISTGRIFLGLVCGDHTKTGINSMFTTGTVAGVCGILVKEWFLPNQINSFTWGGKQNSPLYKFEKAIETARIVMDRRKKVLLDEEIELLKIEYDRITKSNIR
jgi:UDP-N-acetylglucosamine diphosphorylase/glucosamine-1-phosphate N-acetyltransferase